MSNRFNTQSNKQDPGHVVMILHEHLDQNPRKNKKTPDLPKNNRNPTTAEPFNYRKNVLMMFPPLFWTCVANGTPVKNQQKTCWVSQAVVARNPAVVGILRLLPPDFLTIFSSEFSGIDLRDSNPTMASLGGRSQNIVLFFFFGGGGAKLWYRNS